MTASLPPRLCKAACALLTHSTIGAAAAACGISARTFLRWRKLPAFARALDAERRRMVAESTDALRAGSIEAVATLREVMGDTACPAAVRIQAASYVLSHVYKAIEQGEIQEQIAALRERVEEVQAREKRYN